MPSATRRGRLAIVLLAFGALAGCGDMQPEDGRSTDARQRDGKQATVTVTSNAGQRIDGWGASVVSDTPSDPLVVPDLPGRDVRRLDRLVFGAAHINLVRVFGPGYGSEFRTRDLEPRRDDPRFAFMRRVRDYGVRFMLVGADAPADLKKGRVLARDGGYGYAGYLAGLLRFAQDRVGVPFSYVAVANEPDSPQSLLRLQAWQAGQAYQGLAKALTRRRARGRLDPFRAPRVRRAERLRGRLVRAPTRLVLGDNTGWDTTLPYAREALTYPPVPAATAAIASHAYGGDRREMRAVARLARRAGLDVWQTEWGGGCPTCPNDPSMEFALRWSQQIADALVHGGASAWFAFRAVAASDHDPGGALIVRNLGADGPPFHTTKRFDVFRHYSTAGTPGSRVLRTTIEGNGLLAVAFRSKRGVAVVLTNPAARGRRVAVDLGPRSGRLGGRRTTEQQSFRPLPRRRYTGKPARVSLPAQSVTTLVLR